MNPFSDYIQQLEQELERAREELDSIDSTHYQRFQKAQQTIKDKMKALEFAKSIKKPEAFTA